MVLMQVKIETFYRKYMINTYNMC